MWFWHRCWHYHRGGCEGDEGKAEWRGAFKTKVRRAIPQISAGTRTIEPIAAAVTASFATALAAVFPGCAYDYPCMFSRGPKGKRGNRSGDGAASDACS
jgi:hypothetical protein